ncbi:hypothetical protein [Neobacillus sp. PS3-40]|uniref:hypothetical protein n=1 Tax=Neobacillus sp. PS3-40 TaxID=3070679 RepID=UPI0027DF22F3|nr:hypothetical protein [Neobacillus sp. PS3-40]WML43145.1 hypothetical protein RCG20_15225 [Neobacillus sp. PS3-40]
MANDQGIELILNRLNEWRHFPDYQLERRFDIFLSFYLPEIIRKKTNNCNILDEILPEFPVPKRLFNDDLQNTNNKTEFYKVDFVMSDNGDNIYFIEFKTDNRSRSSKQDIRMRKIEKHEVEFISIVKVLIYHCCEGNREKYYKILQSLANWGYIEEESFISLMKQLYDEEYFDIGDTNLGLTIKDEIKNNILFIQPTNPTGDNNVIDYDFIINNLDWNEDDVLGMAIKKYLEKWKDAPL